MSKITIGIIGVGNILGSHTQALKANPDFDLVSVCRRSQDKLREAAEQLNAKGFSDYHDLLADPPDVAMISLPHGMHAQVTLEAFEAGCHVLVEKPMAVSVAECNTMLNAAKSYNKHLIVTESAYFYPGPQRTGEKFQAGQLGRFFTGSIINERFYFHEGRPSWFLDPVMSGGGMFANVGLHRLAIAQAALPGLTPISVSGAVCHAKDYRIEACTSAIVKYKDGGSMLYEEVGYYPKPPWLSVGTHFIFEEGIVSWSDDTWRMMKRNGEQVEEPLDPSPGYAPIYASMLRAVRGEPYEPNARPFAVDTAIAQAAYASSRLNREIDLTSPEWAIAEF